MKIDWESNHCIIVLDEDQKVGYRLEMSNLDSRLLKDFANGPLKYSSGNFPQVLLPLWINWLTTREVKYRLVFLGSKFRPRYWLMRILHNSLMFEYKHKSLKDYKEVYDIYEISE